MADKITKIADVCGAALEEMGMLFDDYDIFGNVEHHILNPDALPSSLHESWVKEMIKLGWSQGTVENTDEKVHPDIVTYDKLPVERHVQDSLVKAITNSLSNFFLR